MENVPAVATASADSASEGVSGQVTLRRGVLGLSNAIVISVAVMSPAFSVFFNTWPQAQVVGAAIPFCIAVGFIAALLVANQYSELSRELPSSGSAYTFVSEGLGPRFGFLTGWIGLVALGLGVPYAFVLMSNNLQALALRWFGTQVHWTVFYVAAVGIIFAICYVGIRQSLRVDLTLLVFEIGVCLVLAAIVLISVGNQGGITAAPFNPASVPPAGDLAVGIVLGVLSFIGFETATALGEETRNPRRNIPRAVYGALILVGIFYLIMTYAGTVGYGINNMVAGYGNDHAPFDTIARKFSGGVMAGLIDIVGVFSALSATLAVVNGGARILFTLARDGMMPRPLGWMARTRRTPAGAAALLCIIGLVSGIPLGLALSPDKAFFFFATLDALFVLLIYVLVNVSCMRFFWRKRRAQFNLLRHGIVPALGLLITGGIAVLALLSPGTGALAVIPFVVVGWLALGIVVSLFVRTKPVTLEMTV
jgi:amino acid transporter